MENKSEPREYKDWRTGKWDRREDAAYTFGYHFIKYCRDQAVDSLPNDMNAEDREKSVEAIHIALHNVLDLVEGFWKLESGKDHFVEYHLQVVAIDKENKEIERISISPGLDLPIGFWKWAKDGEYR
ncbi:MAG: hypothetical protein WCF67_05680 [Chitinophagaceae bacterium]